MDPSHSSAAQDSLGSAARVLARERQKAQLRRERDHILLALGADLGREGLARRLGASDEVAGKLLERARERLSREGSPWTQDGIAARRMRPDPNRWLEADSHFEALGRSMPFAGGARPPRAC